MTVCGNWLQILNEYFARDNCIVLTEDFDFSKTGSLYKTFSKRLQVTKDKRAFPNLVIKSFPSEITQVHNLTRFINIIGDEVQHLKIESILDREMPHNWFNDRIYAKMPNLKSLIVSEELLLGDLVFPQSLQILKLNDVIHDLKQLKKIRKIKNIKSFTSNGIKLCNDSYEPLVPFISAKCKELLKELLGDEVNRSVIVQNSYNYNSGRLKLTPKAVTGLIFDGGINTFTPLIILQFTNLKVITHFLVFANLFSIPFHFFRN